MIIINNGNVFTDIQIKKIIRFLGKDYEPRKIVIYETRFDMLRHYLQCYNFSIEEIKGELEGSYDPATDTVYICVFAQNDDGDDLHSKQLYSIHAMAHELRHRYQAVKNFLTSETDEDRSEKDADKFATKFVNHNARKIKEIMGWKDEWTVEEED